jgi:hypothetical protein
VSAQAFAQPLARPRTGVVAALSALAGAIAILAVVGAVHIAGGSHDTSAPRTFAANGFSIGVPSGWNALSGSDLSRVQGASAVIRRSDGRGVVMVRRTGALTGDLRDVARGLTKQLAARLPGFTPISARLGSVRAGGAFVYTFVSAGKAQTLAVTRIGDTTYRIDSIVPADAPDAARQAGAIVASFGR